MKIYSLDIYNDFKCINSKCKYNCCSFNWEIDIDKKTLKKYKRTNDDFSLSLKNGIDYEKNCFKMKNGQCVFLGKDNLCEIIKNKGEKYLCQVCTDHPRFRNHFKDRIEIGVGLCCEVIASKIVDLNRIIEPCLIKNSILHLNNNKFEKKVLKIRDDLFSILSDDCSFNKKIDRILYNVIEKKEDFSLYNFKEKLLSMEILNDKWKILLNNLDNELSFDCFDKKYNVLYSNLLLCSIFRHLTNSLDNIDIKSRTIFCVFLTLLIANVYEKNKAVNFDKNLLIEIIILTSVEIEYSDENINTLLDVFDNFVLKQE